MSEPKNLADLLKRAVEEDQRRLGDKLAEANQKLLTLTYDKAAAYATVVIFGGYAGFFALWQLAKDHLTKQQSLWSALLILVSMLAFVAFEVLKMIVVTRAIFKKAAALREPENRSDPAKLVRKLEELEQAYSGGTKPLMVSWAIAVCISFGGALVAAAILAFAFIRGLL